MTVCGQFRPKMICSLVNSDPILFDPRQFGHCRLVVSDIVHKSIRTFQFHWSGPFKKINFVLSIRGIDLTILYGSIFRGKKHQWRAQHFIACTCEYSPGLN